MDRARLGPCDRGSDPTFWGSQPYSLYWRPIRAARSGDRTTSGGHTSNAARRYLSQGAEQYRQPHGAPSEPFLDEAAILRGVVAGDKAAFGLLVDRYAARARALALRVTHHHEDAEDLVQDAFMSALARIDGFDRTRPFWPWFSRILVNRGLDLVSSRSRRSTDALDSASHAFTTHSSDAAVEDREIMERFSAALAQLPPKTRLIVEMFEIDGESVSSIATQLGIHAPTVRWHLHKGRRELRRALGIFRAASA